MEALNKQLKKKPCVYKINAVELDAADVKVVADITWKNGKIKKVNAIKVTADLYGRKKTFRLQPSQYKIKVKNASEKIVKITGKSDFKGSVTVKAK